MENSKPVFNFRLSPLEADSFAEFRYFEYTNAGHRFCSLSSECSLMSLITYIRCIMMYR